MDWVIWVKFADGHEDPYGGWQSRSSAYRNLITWERAIGKVVPNTCGQTVIAARVGRWAKWPA